MLPVPVHLKVADLQSPVVRFHWDDGDTEQVEERPDEPFVDALRRMSDRAILALTVAMAEWIVFRFQPFADVSLPSHFLEAAWAAGADWRYHSEAWDAIVDAERWTGPIKGPVSAAMFAVDVASQGYRVGDDLTDSALSVSNIALHVLPQSERFRDWRDRSVARLTVLYPRNENDAIGPVVPREVFELTREYDSEYTEQFLNGLLRSLDYHANPFLASPETLKETGFVGKPYTFDLARDREERLKE